MQPRITARHLLSHSGGLANPIPVGWIHPADTAGPDPDAFLDGLLSKHGKLRFEPGTRSSYSNLGTLVLGAAMANLADTPFVDLVRGRGPGRRLRCATGFAYTPEIEARAASATTHGGAHAMAASTVGDRCADRTMGRIQPFQLGRPGVRRADRLGDRRRTIPADAPARRGVRGARGSWSAVSAQRDARHPHARTSGSTSDSGGSVRRPPETPTHPSSSISVGEPVSST